MNTKKKNAPNINQNFATKSDGLRHTSDFCRKHKLVIEQQDGENFRLLDWVTADPVSKKRELAFYKDLVRSCYFIDW